MPRLFFAVVIACLITILAFARDRQPPAGADEGFRVMTLNTQAGVDSRGRYDLPRVASTIASLRPSIVGLQEMTRNHAVYNCDDQAALLAQFLRHKTGRPWTHVYVNEWLTTERSCVDSGRGDDVTTEGLALLAPEPLLEVEHVELFNGRLGLSARLASAPDVAIVVTHLASGTGNAPDRVKQIAALLPWTQQRGRTQILIGDFNAEPETPELRPLMAAYHDAWAEAAESGHIRGVVSGSTRPKRVSRIDYVFYEPSDALQLQSVDVIDTSSLFSSEVSDHRPVVATFTRPPAAGAARVTPAP